MHAIIEHVYKLEEEGDMTPRSRSQGHKRRAPGQDAPPIDPTVPDDIGGGLFKAGTRHINGILCCPADMPFDTQEGHNQSVVLDKISEALAKLHKMRQEITGDKSDNILNSWEVLNADTTQGAAASSGPRLKRLAFGARWGRHRQKRYMMGYHRLAQGGR